MIVPVIVGAGIVRDCGWPLELGSRPEQERLSLDDRRRRIRRGDFAMSMADYQYIAYKNVEGVAVVNFMETVSMFDTDKVRDVGIELMDLVESKKYTKLLLNLSNARFVSSAMLANLVKLHRKIKEVKGGIRLCCLRPVIMDAFKVSNFDRIFEIFPDEATALKKF
jgi:anti-sigma B factor antagonist